MSERRRPRSVHCVCPVCDEEFLGELAPGARVDRCPSCRAELAGGASAPAVGQAMERCAVCGGSEFYVQKDFNRQLGIVIVLTSFLATFIVMITFGHREGIYCLFALAAIDAIAYRMLPVVTVCYLCQSVYRGFPLHPDHRGFYLGTEEKHKPLRQRWLADRAVPSGAADESPS